MGSHRRAFFVPVEALLRLGLWLVLLAVVAYTRTDPDLWGHVRFGLDILREHHLSAVDPYSFTSDREWINHEWAAEALFAFAFTMSRFGLVLLKLLVVGCSLLLVNRSVRLDGVSHARHRDWLGAAVVITTVQQAHHVRPQIFSLLFFTLLISCVLESTRFDRQRWLTVVPFLFAVWANFHGGWIVGGGALVLWTVGSVLVVIPERRTYISTLMVTGAVALIATLANPYGIGLWRFLWQTVGINRADIIEWQPIYALDPSIWGLWIITAVLAGVGVARRGRSLDPRRTLVVLVLALSSFFVNRLLSFFALSTILLLGSAIVGTRIAPSTAGARAGSRLAGVMISSAMIVGGVFAVVINVACIRVDARTAPEPSAVSVLKAQTGGQRLLVWFDWGEYAIWHLAPSMKVSIDGRRETVYSANLQNRHLRFFFDAPGGVELVQQIAPDYVWIPLSLPATRRLRAMGWNVLYEGQTSAIFARPGVSATRSGPGLSDETLRCFPDP